jgi:hypothetical protein
MSWTFSGMVQFLFDGKPTTVSAHGHHVAWRCPCGSPVMFAYEKGQPGSSAAKPATCPGCASKYHLDPPHGNAEPPAGMPVSPSPVMRIVKTA